jgi:hypothetical protein
VRLRLLGCEVPLGGSSRERSENAERKGRGLVMRATVWFKDKNDRSCVFMSGVLTSIALSIADNLMLEEFTENAWVEED